MHGVSSADGLPEDGVRPPDLLAEPPQRLPHRHRRSPKAQRNPNEQTLASSTGGEGDEKTSKDAAASLGAARAGAPGLPRADPAVPLLCRNRNANTCSVGRRRAASGHQWGSPPAAGAGPSVGGDLGTTAQHQRQRCPAGEWRGVPGGASEPHGGGRASNAVLDLAAAATAAARPRQSLSSFSAFALVSHSGDRKSVV